MDTNRKHCNELSLDTGAFAGLLFEIGTQKLLLGKDEYLSEIERNRLEKLIEKRHKEKVRKLRMNSYTMKCSIIC